MDQPTSTSFNVPGHFAQPSMEVDSEPTIVHLPTSGSTPHALSSAAEGSSALVVPAVVPVPSTWTDTLIRPSKRPLDNSMEHTASPDPSMTTIIAHDARQEFRFTIKQPEWPDIGRRGDKRVAIAGPNQLALDNARTDNKDLKQSLQVATAKVQSIYQNREEALAAAPALFEALGRTNPEVAANLQAIYTAVDLHRRTIEDTNTTNKYLHEQNKVLEAERIRLSQENLAHQTARDNVLAEAAKVGRDAADATRLADQRAQELAEAEEAAKKKDEAHRKELGDLSMKLQEEKRLRTTAENERSTELNRNRQRQPRRQSPFPVLDDNDADDERSLPQPTSMLNSSTSHRRSSTTANTSSTSTTSAPLASSPSTANSAPPTAGSTSSSSKGTSSPHQSNINSSSTTASTPSASSPSTGHSAPRTTGGTSSSSDSTSSNQNNANPSSTTPTSAPTASSPSTGNSAPHTTGGTSSSSGTSSSAAESASSSTTSSSTSSGPGPGASPFPSNIFGDPAALVQEFFRYMASASQGATHTTTQHASPTATPTHRNARREHVVHTPRPGSNNHKKALKQKAKNEIPKKLQTLWDRMLRRIFLSCTAMERVCHFEGYEPIEAELADAYELGNGSGPEGDNQFRLFFGEGWNRHAWNRKVVDNMVLLVPAKKRTYTELRRYEMSEEVLQTWFWGFIRDARGSWTRSQPRVHTSGRRLETPIEAKARAERYAADRARRVRVTNHKHNKYYRRLDGAANLLKEADSDPRVGEWQRARNLLEQLEANAMSSECTDDEEIYGPSRVLVVSTPHFRRRCIGPLMESLDEAIRTLGGSRSPPTRQRKRLTDVSYNTTAKNLPRSCYHNSFLQRLTPQELGELEVRNSSIPLFDRWAGRMVVSDTEDEDAMSLGGSGAEE